MSEKITVTTIKSYPSNLMIWGEGDHINNLNFDGQIGELSREEWIEYYLSEYDKKSQERILNALEGRANHFFSEIND